MNGMLSAVMAKGQTVLENCAKEPHVVDLSLIHILGGDAPADAMVRCVVERGVLAHQAGDKAARVGICLLYTSRCV